MSKGFERFYWLKQNGTMKIITREQALRSERAGKTILWFYGNYANILRSGSIPIDQLKNVIARFEEEKIRHSGQG
jgi:hypothetical protein